MHNTHQGRAGFVVVPVVILGLWLVGLAPAWAQGFPGKPGCGEMAFSAKQAQAEAWRHSRSTFVAGLGEPRHRLSDVMVVRGSATAIVGKFAYGPLDKDLEAEAVELFGQVPGACTWRSMGRRVTEQHGVARPTDATKLDDGEAVWQVDTRAWPVGAYPVRAVVLGDLTEVEGWIYVVPEGAHLVVSDIDGTLCEEAQDAAGMASTLMAGVEALRRFEGALETIGQWVKRGYLPVYLTGRPGALKPATIRWLTKQGFPKGPVVVARTSGDVIPSRTGVQAFKARTIRGWLEVGLVVHAAYGNAKTDIGAYAEAGLCAARTFIVGRHRGSSGTAKWPGYTGQHRTWIGNQPKQ